MKKQPAPDKDMQDNLEEFRAKVKAFTDERMVVSSESYDRSGYSGYLRQLSPAGWTEYLKWMTDLPKQWTEANEPRVDGPGADWPRLGIMKEVMSQQEHADPGGQLYGYGSHMNLLVAVTSVGCTGPTHQAGEAFEEVKSKSAVKCYSEQGWQKKAVKKQKTNYWKENGEWPWWIPHDGEYYYWSDENSDGFVENAVRWRWSMDAWTGMEDAEGYDTATDSQRMERSIALVAYNKGWIELYGEDAHHLALQTTQKCYLEARAKYESYIEWKWKHPVAAKKWVGPGTAKGDGGGKGKGNTKGKNVGKGKVGGKGQVAVN